MPTDNQTNLLDALNQRRSTPSRLLGDPGPTEIQLVQILQAAVRVPDHGQLTPWRFIRIQGDARDALGEALVARHRQIDAFVNQAALDKDRSRFSYAPLIITVVGRMYPEHKVPVFEQMHSGACVCFALMQAAQALGFASQWLTGWAAYDTEIEKMLGIERQDRILGFIHIGTAKEAFPERQRPDPMALLSDWSPT